VVLKIKCTHDQEEMLRKFFSGIICATIFFACFDANAFHFESYKWGETVLEVKDQLQTSGKKILSESPSGIEYEDTLFGEVCRVYLYFTSNIDGQLAMVGVKWSDNFVGEKVKAELIQKYGQPHQPNDYTEKYIWLGEEDKDEIRLDYDDSQTKIYYLGGRFYNEFEKKNEEKPAGKLNEI